MWTPGRRNWPNDPRIPTVTRAWMSRAAGYGAVVALAGLACGRSARAGDDLLAMLVPEGAGQGICFKIGYDKAHLAAHPKQTSLSLLLSLQFDISRAGNGGRFVRIALQRKGTPAQVYMVGGCGWSETANLDQRGHKLFPAKTNEGIACSVMGDLHSDDEGGEILIQPAPDIRSALVFLPAGLAAWSSADQSGKATPLDIGPDDRAFRLNSVYPENCSSLAKLRVK